MQKWRTDNVVEVHVAPNGRSWLCFLGTRKLLGLKLPAGEESAESVKILDVLGALFCFKSR